MNIEPAIRTVLDGTPIAHLATLLPDGSPHSVPLWIGTHGDHIAILTGPDSVKARNVRRDPRVAISLTPPDNPFAPIVLRGTVVGWIGGEEGWNIVDRIATKYIGASYPRNDERQIALIELTHQSG